MTHLGAYNILGPGLIGAAVHNGHLFARTLSTDLTDEVPFRRKRVEIDLHQSLPPASAPGATSRIQLSLDEFARR